MPRGRRSFTRLLVLLGSAGSAGCVGLRGTEPPLRRTVGCRSDLVAAVCARVVRLAYPAADDRPYCAGAMLYDRGRGRYGVELLEEWDGTQRSAGNLRLAVRANADADSLVAGLAVGVERQSTPPTAGWAAVRGRITVSIEPTEGGTVVVVQTLGSLQTSDVCRRIDATLVAAEAVRRCQERLLRGDAGAAAYDIESAVVWLQGPQAAPDPQWAARIYLAGAAAHLAAGRSVEAQQALANAVALAPNLTFARRQLARLARDLAQPDAADTDARRLATTPGLGFAALCDGARVENTRTPRTDDSRRWLVAAAERLRAGDLASARRHALCARGHGRDADAEAMGLLAAIAEADRDDRLAFELRLAQAQLKGFTPEIVVALGRSLQRRAQPDRAVRWLVAGWDDVQHLAAARALMRDLVSGIGLREAARHLASAPVAGLGPTDGPGQAPPSTGLGRGVAEAPRPGSPSRGAALTEPAASPPRE